MGRSNHIPLAARTLPLAVMLARGGKLDRPFPAFAARLRVSALALGPPALGDNHRRLVPEGLSARRWFGRVRRNNRDPLLARRFARQRRREVGLHTTLPGFRRTSGNYFHIVLRFVRQLALFVEPVLDAPRPGIIGSGS